MCKRNSQSSKEGDSKCGKPKRSIRRKFIDIVILIALIALIYNLRPRTCCVKGTNRDVARRNDLSQIETAIENYKDTYGEWPDLENAKRGTTVSSIQEILAKVGLSRGICQDPVEKNEVYGLGDAKEEGEYLYMVTKKDGLENGGFILMASTEWEGGTNWIVCKDGSGLEQGYITNDTDINDIKLCNYRVDQSDICSPADCKYKNFNEELRYIVIH